MRIHFRQFLGKVAPTNDRYDLVFVVAPQNRDEILESICRYVARHVPGTTAFHYAGSPLPSAEAYFFSHYLLFLEARRDPRLRSAASIVLYTHPSYPPREARAVARRLRSATHIVSCSSMWAELLTEGGVPAAKVTVARLGADAARFRRHERAGKPVGLCSTYRGPRKAPETILELVRAMPHREFRLLGQRWPEAPVFASLAALPNFRYLELDYSDYPQFYDDIDVFVSPSEVEGGPVPLLEAMMSNVVPVATRTGFAPDLISHGQNGFLCDVDAPTEVFVDLVEAAYRLDADVRSTVEHLTWDAFADSILRLAFSNTTG